MKNLLSLFIALFSLYCLNAQVVNVTSYGATPNDSSNDDRVAIRAAIDACKTLSAPVLVFPKGTYHLNSNNGSGSYLSVNGINNLTIDGSGSTIKILGIVYNRNVFTFSNCKNLNVKNFVIDYEEVPFSQGKVVASGADYMDVKIFDGFKPEGKAIRAYAEYDSIRGQQISDRESFARYDQGTGWNWQDKSNNILRIFNPSPNYVEGTFMVMRHAQYDGYSFTIYGGCENVVLDSLTILLAPGYPFYANDGAKNLSFLNCRIQKKQPNYWVTSTVDGAHMLDVRGKLEFDNCYFESMCDDGINLHGYYLSIVQKVDSNTLKVFSPSYSWYTANGYAVGDTIEYTDFDTQQYLGSNTIANIISKNGDQMTLQFNEPIPAFSQTLDKIKLANISNIASLTVKNSTFKGNRARGILVNTKEALIENCTFDRTTMPAIILAVGNSFGESTVSRNVIIRNNVFDDCCHYRNNTSSAIIHINAGTTTTPICDVYNNISITENTFKNIGVPAVYALHVDGLEVANNTIESADFERNLIRYGQCKNQVIANNTGAVIDNMGGNCGPELVMDPNSLSLWRTQTAQLTVLAPIDDAQVVWSSNDINIATVDENGLVTAEGKGLAIITATTVNGGLTASCLVDVTTNDMNIAYKKPVTTKTNNASPAPGLVDENLTTFWSASTFPQWAEIDLGDVYEINKFEVFPYQNRAYKYIIEAKIDANSTYTTVVDRSANNIGGFLFSDDVFVTGRYLRITVTGASGYTGSSTTLNEFKAFGTLAGTLSTPTINEQLYSIYPNPVDDIIQVELPNANLSNVQFKLYDILGQLVYEEKVDATKGKWQIDVSDLTQGIHILEIIADKKVTHYKVVKK